MRSALPFLLLLSGTVFADDPYVGYVYPAAVEAGTTNKVVVGGQYFGEGMKGWVSGAGVEVVAVERVPSFPHADGKQSRYLKDWLEAIEHGTNSVLALPPLGPNDSWRSNRWWQALNELGPKERAIVARDLWVRKNALQAAPSLRQMLVLTVAARADATPGMRQMRLLRKDAISAPHPFEVTAAPVLEEPLYAPPVRRDARHAAVVSNFPAVVVGQVMPGETDRFGLWLRGGERMRVDVKARAYEPYVGDAVPGFFNAVIAIRDAAGAEVAFADDSDRQDPDPHLRFTVPADGFYRLEIADRLFRGREDFVYSAAISPDAETDATCPPAETTSVHRVTVDRPGWKVFEVLARRIGSPMDARMTLRDAKGTVLAVWDDVTNRVLVGTVIQTELDPVGAYDFAEAGEYAVEVADTCGKTGPDIRHRLAVRDPEPCFEVTARRSGLMLAEGERRALPLAIERREGFSGSVTLVETPYVRFEKAIIPAGTNEWTAVAVGKLNLKDMPPVVFDILAVGEHDGRVIGAKVTAADECDQAFAWRHLVPAGGFVYKCCYRRPKQESMVQTRRTK